MTIFSSSVRRLGLVTLLGLAPLAGLTAPAAATPATPTSPATPANPELGHAGRWLTDDQGRVVTLHGVNLVYKKPPYFPAAGGFGDKDAQFLADNGFNVVRLGFAWSAAEPQPGVYDDDYIEQIKQTQQLLARHNIYSLIDSHQDAYNESVGASWNGFPDWATYTDGFPLQPDPGFPEVYFTSPSQNQTWRNLWHDHAAPDGEGLQEHYAAMWGHVAKHFAGERYVLGYDLINEPWPGWEYPTCLPNGCPQFETQALAQFQAKPMKAIREADPNHLLFFEPPMLNDFGIPNWMPNPTGDPKVGMSFHDYCLGKVDTCITNGLERSVTDGVAALVTEFGAITDAAKLTDLTDRFDGNMASWIFWAYAQNQTPGHQQQPPTGPNLMEPAIVRPYPRAIAGTPQQWNYNNSTGTFTLQYTARHVDTGQPFAPEARTEVFLPPSDYPGGYQVQSQGAVVVSAPNASMLQLATIPGQANVQVTVARR